MFSLSSVWLICELYVIGSHLLLSFLHHCHFKLINSKLCMSILWLLCDHLASQFWSFPHSTVQKFVTIKESYHYCHAIMILGRRYHIDRRWLVDPHQGWWGKAIFSLFFLKHPFTRMKTTLLALCYIKQLFKLQYATWQSCTFTKHVYLSNQIGYLV